MTDFFERLSILLGGATVIAVGVVLFASGILEFGLDRRLRAGLIPSVGLLSLSILIAVWYESSGSADEST